MPRSHTDALAGATASRAEVTTASLSRTRSTSSRARSPNDCTTFAASTWARSNRRSSGAWTRPRIGTKSAATSSVDPGDGDRALAGRGGDDGLEQEVAGEEHRREERRDDCVGERPADDPVDVVQAVAQDGDTDGRGQGAREREPERVKRIDREEHGDQEHRQCRGGTEPPDLGTDHPSGAAVAPNEDDHAEEQTHDERKQANSLDRAQDRRVERIDPDRVHAGGLTGHDDLARGEHPEH